jgi:hypothetical protein
METTNTNQEDFGIAVYILKVLSVRKTTLMSWGFNTPTVITDGLQFMVNGFKHSGLVQVIYQHGLDLFKIILLTNEMDVIKEIKGNYFDELVTVIDEHVELVENYEDRVKQEYTKSETHSNDDCIQINLN